MAAYEGWFLSNTKKCCTACASKDRHAVLLFLLSRTAGCPAGSALVEVLIAAPTHPHAKAPAANHACAALVQGQGKRIPISQMRLLKGRIGKGHRVMRLGKGDRLAAAMVVGAPSSPAAAALGAGPLPTGPAAAWTTPRGGEQADVVNSTDQGLLVRLSLEDIKVQRRTAKGVRVIKLQEGDEVSAITLVRKAVS
jgi:DNA gyrase/topoisomerase IV subunit A